VGLRVVESESFRAKGCKGFGVVVKKRREKLIFVSIINQYE
jgi:hypothetical protein